MDATFIQKWMRDFNETIEAQKDYLTLLDQPIGDSDHGHNLSRGMSAVMESFEKTPPQQASDAFRLIAMALISKVGGASGPLYGTAFMEMSKAAKENEESSDLDLFTAAFEGIKKRGQSDVGQKTMLDAWAPFLDALKDDQLDEGFLSDLAERTTKDLLATKGRASYLGERSIGHIDPGAQSSQYLFEAYLKAKGE